MTEYESDGNVNEYKLEDCIDPCTDIVARTATEPLSEPQRVASWMDIIQPNGKPPEPSPWTPPALSQLERKTLGKLGEEVNELGTVLFRIHIQGLDALVPGSTKTNRQWLEEEIADVLTTAAKVVKHNKLDLEFIETRAKNKDVYLEKWYMTPDIDPNGHKELTQ